MESLAHRSALGRMTMINASMTTLPPRVSSRWRVNWPLVIAAELALIALMFWLKI